MKKKKKGVTFMSLTEDELEKLIQDKRLLEDVVLDLKLEEAARINDAGTYAQVEYILSNLGDEKLRDYLQEMEEMKKKKIRG
jgi:hypothetical protein